MAKKKSKRTEKKSVADSAVVLPEGARPGEAWRDKTGHSSSGGMKEAAEVCGGGGEGEATLLPPPPGVQANPQ